MPGARPGRSTIRGLDHFIVLVGGEADLEARTEDFGKLLGRACSWRGRHPEYGTCNSLFALDNCYLELLALEEGAPQPAHLVGQGPGLGGLAFATKDAGQCAVALRERGLPATEPVPGSGREARTGARRHWRNVFLPRSATRGLFIFCIEHLDGEAFSAAAPLPTVVPLPGGGEVEGLDHLVITTTNPAAAISFYGDQLGLRLALDRRPEKHWGDAVERMLFFRTGGVTLEVVGRLDESAPQVDSLWGLALKVADLKATRDRLAGAGVALGRLRDGRKPGTRVCTVKSHNAGIPTLLIEHLAGYDD